MAAVGDIYEVVWMMTMDNQQLRMVRHYQLLSFTGGTPASDTVVAIGCNVAMTNISTTLKSQLATTWALVAVKSQRTYPLPRTFGALSTVNAGPGTAAGTALPAECCGVIRLTTDFAGKKYRGRSYISGLITTYASASSLSAAGLTAVSTIGTQLAINCVGLSAGITYTFSPVITHKATPGSIVTINNTNTDTVIRSQRRRQVGKGK